MDMVVALVVTASDPRVHVADGHTYRRRECSGGEQERDLSASDEVMMRLQRKSFRRTSPRGRLWGCHERCLGRGRSVFVIVVFICHDAILTHFFVCLFPPLPENAAAARAVGHCFVARWLRPFGRGPE